MEVSGPRVGGSRDGSPARVGQTSQQPCRIGQKAKQGIGSNHDPLVEEMPAFRMDDDRCARNMTVSAELERGDTTSPKAWVVAT